MITFEDKKKQIDNNTNVRKQNENGRILNKIKMIKIIE